MASHNGDVDFLEKNFEHEKAQPVARQKKTSLSDQANSEASLIKQQNAAAKATYGRGKPIPIGRVKDKKLRGKLKALEGRYKEASLKAKDAEILLEHPTGFLEAEGDLEKTFRVRQQDIQENLDVQSARKGFEIKLDNLGPYTANYTRNGRQLLLTGRKGHVATMEWREGKLGCEIHLGETIRASKWLHNDQSFAVSQKKHVFIYDKQGVEIHKLADHVEVTHMDFLPYHFLLATIGNAGYLKYTDTSTGQMIAEMPTKQGSPTAFRQNPYNAVLHVGHQNGTVSLWSPNSTSPLVKLLAHRGPVRALAMDREGRYMVSGGQDLKMAVWDIRMFREVHNYQARQPISSIDISDRGLAAVGWGTQVSIWKGLFNKSAAVQEKAQRPYMSWGGEGQRIEKVTWCPFEDVLGVAHDQGFSSIIVPGAGEPNFDALEVNPYENVKQRQESEVKSLLHKLQPEMISLNPDYVGNLDLASAQTRKRERDLDRPPEDELLKLKNRGRGKNSSLRKHLRKKGSKNIIDERRLRIQALIKEQNQKSETRLQLKEAEYGPALARFARKSG